MRRVITFVIPAAFIALLILSSGCGASKTGGQKTDGVKEDRQDHLVTQTDYDLGLEEGYEDGYDQGYEDGRAHAYGPHPELAKGWSEDYAAGYEEGFHEGYEDGYNRAMEEAGSDTGDAAEVEAAMLDLAKENSAPGMEFEIKNIVIHGDQAAGIVVCTSEKLESPLIVVAKGPGGWYLVDFGTGVEAPSWYPYY